MGDETLNQSPTPAPAAAPATTAPDFSAVPGHQIEDSSVMTTPKAQQDANTQTVTLPRMGRVKMNTEENPGDFVEGLNKFTEPIENYTPQGRKEHPVLAQLGDVTRNVKEALEGGKAAGKPMGTSASPFVEEANVLSGAEGGAEDLAKGEELVREYAPKAIGHLAEAGKGFLTDLLEDARAGLEAKHPEGSLEAGFAKIPGHKSEGPKLPKKPEVTPHVEPTSEEAANKKAEADLAAARANYTNNDMEKNPSAFKKGTPVQEQIVHIDPNKVIKKVNPGGNTFDEPTVQKYQQKIRQGEEIPAVRIEYGKTGGIEGYDGRHRAEAARREGVPLKVWTRREVEPGEAPPTEIGPSDENPHELNGDENDIPEAAKPRPAPATVAPNDEVAESAQRYNANNGQEEIDHTPAPLPAQEDRTHLADAYDRAQHEPNNPEVQHAYQAFKNETLEQFQHAQHDLGIKVDFTPNDPYKSAAEMQADLRNNHHLSVFTGGDLPADHPMAEIEPSTGQPYNNVFRATHDIYGHAAGGHDFTEAGEQAAYGAHSQMYSPDAQPAMRTETQGQSNWFFNNKGVREGAEPGAFPEQKATILPERDENAYHPDLQAVADKYGTSDDAYKASHGASFITPDGKYIHSGSGHPEMIADGRADTTAANGLRMSDSAPGDSRVGFINDTGAIRTRAMFGHQGHSFYISVPEKGVTPDQVDALKAATRQALGGGKSGSIVMEIATPGGKSVTVDFANANNIEPMLKEIGAHPDKTPAETPHWSETAAQQGEKNGGFTVDPRTGNIPQSGHILEVAPEVRQVSDKPNTPAQIQKFADSKPVKKLLAKNPELMVGGYKNDAGKYELNLSAVTNDSSKAEKVAKALDQESYYNASEGKIVPTGGKNVQQAFPDYPVAQRLRDLAPEEPGMTISTRQPSSVKYSTEDPLRHNLRLTNDLISKNPALADKWANVVKDYPGFQAPEGADTQTTLNAFIEHAKDNLKHLYNSLPVEDQEKNKVWYDGAHTLTKELANKHGITHPQAAGVVAALSPQKDWDQNVSLARRLTDIVKNKQDTVAGPDMLAKAKEIREASTTAKNPNANKYLVELAKSIQGKKLSELSDVDKKAAFVRLHDEINNPRKYFKINPDGSNGEIYKKADGTDGQVAWGSLNEIGKAINILEDGSRENISDNLGQAHKVRHFYNNIIEPNSARGDVTVDTHAVAAALMRPLGGKNPEVLANFEGPGSNVHGLSGTYPLYHEAYTRAAKELDIEHPRQLQSVVWEHIRNQFPAEFKTEENQNAINGIWKEAQNGKITAEDARKQILEYAQGHRVAADEGIQRPSDQTELSGHGVHGESAGGHGRGDRGEHSVGSETERPPAESSGKETTGGWLKMLQSKPKK